MNRSEEALCGFLIDGRRPATFVLLAVLTLVWVIFLAAAGTDGAGAMAVGDLGRISPLIWMGQWWRLLTALVAHRSTTHLLVNCVALFIFGSYLEDRVGAMRFLLVFIFSGLAGGLTSMALVSAASVGASAGIVGVMAATLAILMRYPADEGEVTRQVVGLGAAAGILLIIGAGAASPGMDHYAHAGGFTAGALLGMAIGTRERTETAVRRAALLLLAALLAAGAVPVLRPVPRDMARYWYRRGVRSYNAGDHLAARSDWIRATTWDPDFATAHFSLAMLSQRQHDSQGFKLELAEALRLEPANPDALEQMGILGLEYGAPETAEKFLKLTVRLVPDRARTWLLLAQAQQELHRPRDAAASYHRALSLEPHNPAALDGAARLYQDDLHDPDAALPLWKRLAARQPADADDAARVARAKRYVAAASRRHGAPVLTRPASARP